MIIGRRKEGQRKVSWRVAPRTQGTDSGTRGGGREIQVMLFAIGFLAISGILYLTRDSNEPATGLGLARPCTHMLTKQCYPELRNELFRRSQPQQTTYPPVFPSPPTLSHLPHCIVWVLSDVVCYRHSSSFVFVIRRCWLLSLLFVLVVLAVAALIVVVRVVVSFIVVCCSSSLSLFWSSSGRFGVLFVTAIAVLRLHCRAHAGARRTRKP